MMKKICLSVLTGMMILLLNGGAFAGEYTYNPTPGNLNDLDHGKAYVWGIDTSNILSNNETIVGASLFFNDIRNHDNSSNVLFVNLLNTSLTLGVSQFSDNYNYESNYFYSGDKYSSLSLFRFEDLTTTSKDITVDITNLDSAYNGGFYNSLQDSLSWVAESPDRYDRAKISMGTNALNNLIAYASDGIFGLGFDPDCHFWNNGITLTLYTTPNETPGDHVPEPATLMLFGAGLLGLASRMRKKTQVA